MVESRASIRKLGFLKLKRAKLLARIDEDGSDVEALEELGALYHEEENYQEAIQFLTKAVKEQHIFTPRILATLGCSFYATGALEKANNVFRHTMHLSLLQGNPLDFGVWGHIVRTKVSMGNYSDGLAIAKIAIKQGIPCQQSSTNRLESRRFASLGSLQILAATLASHLGVSQEALSFLEDAHRNSVLDLRPYSVADVWMLVGRVYENIGRADCCEKAYVRSQLNTELPGVWNNLAKLHESQHNFIAACDAYEQANIRDPLNSNYLSGLEKCLEKVETKGNMTPIQQRVKLENEHSVAMAEVQSIFIPFQQPASPSERKQAQKNRYIKTVWDREGKPKRKSKHKHRKQQKPYIDLAKVEKQIQDHKKKMQLAVSPDEQRKVPVPASTIELKARIKSKVKSHRTSEISRQTLYRSNLSNPYIDGRLGPGPPKLERAKTRQSEIPQTQFTNKLGKGHSSSNQQHANKPKESKWLTEGTMLHDIEIPPVLPEENSASVVIRLPVHAESPSPQLPQDHDTSITKQEETAFEEQRENPLIQDVTNPLEPRIDVQTDSPDQETESDLVESAPAMSDDLEMGESQRTHRSGDGDDLGSVTGSEEDEDQAMLEQEEDTIQAAQALLNDLGSSTSLSIAEEPNSSNQDNPESLEHPIENTEDFMDDLGSDTRSIGEESSSSDDPIEAARALLNDLGSSSGTIGNEDEAGVEKDMFGNDNNTIHQREETSAHDANRKESPQELKEEDGNGNNFETEAEEEEDPIKSAQALLDMFGGDDEDDDIFLGASFLQEDENDEENVQIGAELLDGSLLSPSSLSEGDDNLYSPDWDSPTSDFEFQNDDVDLPNVDGK